MKTCALSEGENLFEGYFVVAFEEEGEGEESSVVVAFEALEIGVDSGVEVRQGGEGEVRQVSRKEESFPLVHLSVQEPKGRKKGGGEVLSEVGQMEFVKLEERVEREEGECEAHWCLVL